MKGCEQLNTVYKLKRVSTSSGAETEGGFSSYSAVDKFIPLVKGLLLFCGV